MVRKPLVTLPVSTTAITPVLGRVYGRLDITLLSMWGAVAYPLLSKRIEADGAFRVVRYNIVTLVSVINRSSSSNTLNILSVSGIVNPLCWDELLCPVLLDALT